MRGTSGSVNAGSTAHSPSVSTRATADAGATAVLFSPYIGPRSRMRGAAIGGRMRRNCRHVTLNALAARSPLP